MKLEFKRLSEIDCSEYAALNTHPLMMCRMLLSDSSIIEMTGSVWSRSFYFISCIRRSID